MDGTNIALIKGDAHIYSPQLAAAFGDIDKAIILQTVYYWCKVNESKRQSYAGGFYWAYNTYNAWRQCHYPWMSESVLKRKIAALENEGYLISGRFNKMSGDKTKWYRVDVEKVNALVRIDQPNTVHTPAKVSLPYAVKVDSSLFDTYAFQRSYADEYMRKHGIPHPQVSVKALTKALKSITQFADEYMLRHNDLIEMAKLFFASVKESDHSICHFASPQILVNRLVGWNR